MSKAKLIAVSAMCSAVAFGCMMLCTLPGVRWIMLILGVVASIAVAIPIMIDIKNWVYSLLIYLASSALAVFFGLANIVYVAPIVAFCIPFAVIKVVAETPKITAQIAETEVQEDPFDSADDKTVVKIKVQTKRLMPAFIKWILYFVVLECAIGLTVLATWLFTKDMFNTITQSKMFWWIVGAAQLVVYPYDALMHGCLLGTSKILHKTLHI